MALQQYSESLSLHRIAIAPRKRFLRLSGSYVKITEQIQMY